MKLTLAQQEAITARGNVLVVAGAGTGKTSTLVERVLHCLLEEKPPASLDEILMVTFTEAAAAEIRQRIRARLEEEINKRPGESRWKEQLALFETAHIGTLHSFCLQLVRQHFYELELDPQLSVLAEEEARLLAEETLDTLFRKHYAGPNAAAEAVRQLIQTQGRGWDKPIRSLVRRLHHYTQTRPDSAGWFRGQLAMFADPEPRTWQRWLVGAMASWRDRWLPVLENMHAQNDIARKCATALRKLPAEDRNDGTMEHRRTASSGSLSSIHQSTNPLIHKSNLPSFRSAFEAISSARQECPRGKKGAWLDPLKDFLSEADFLGSLLAGPGDADPLAEDWNWVRSQITTLLELAQEFTNAFTEAKREQGVLDFHDLEQYALRLLWDFGTNGPTRITHQWRKRLRFVFVDEYQDINAAQDKIIEALGREGPQTNRFLVGDVKQSIYRFRLADPRIFQGYVETWGNRQSRAIPLVENFRSREGILNFVNGVFGALMRRELGGVDYDETARLRFGAPEERRSLGAAADPQRRVELHLRLKGGANSEEGEEEAAEALAQVADFEEADKEARLVALRLRELKAEHHLIWDEKAKTFRPVDWNDMAVLLRSPANKAESYAKEFSRLNVPLQVARGGFYQSLEISDLLSLFKLLDNPLQDLPVLAVLHSPLVGLTLDELATIRLAGKGPFWTVLVSWTESLKCEVQSLGGCRVLEHGTRNTEHVPSESFHKVTAFLNRFTHWRRLVRQVSLSRCLETVLAETHYADWLLTQPRGEQRHANVERLLGLARQFDQFQRQGLFRFLRFIEAQQMAETEPEVAKVSEENSVRLLSIHQSKGLEFPVVVVADLGKPFNVSDLRAEIILDEEYGLCPQIQPSHTGRRYPSLPYWLARQRQAREMLGEELRLLYVATTRARDTLILTATLPAATFERVWNRAAESQATGRRSPTRRVEGREQRAGSEAGVPSKRQQRAKTPDDPALLSARSYADWLGSWFAQNCASEEPGVTQGENAWLRWTIHDDTKLISAAAEPLPLEAPTEATTAADAEACQILQARLAWEYPFEAATRQPAKTSVSVLRRRAAEQPDEEAARWTGIQSPKSAKVSSQLSVASGVERQPTDYGLRTTDHGPRITEHETRNTEHASSSAEIGSANHAFLQLVSLERAGGAADLKAEAERLVEARSLTADQSALLDFDGLAGFWQSELGRKIRDQAQHVRRELAFTCRFSTAELAELTGQPPEPNLDGEFVVVQGVADAAAILPQEIWLVDFKTDRVESGELSGKAKHYAPQLKLYALALTKIYRRPVSGCWLYFLSCQTAVVVT
jgi:ATP-dependent helicase/nuclease subunit A